LKKYALKKSKMNYKVATIDDFERDFKRLFKKYRSLKADVAALKEELLKNPTMGDQLGANSYKVRMAITSKGGGKSGGARVITCHVLINVELSKIYLLTMYDKGEQDTISMERIKQIKQKHGLS
jgi:mRNA-degrading endonuclease RelE of RelBE toxin-antitoxin system